MPVQFLLPEPGRVHEPQVALRPPQEWFDDTDDPFEPEEAIA